VTFKNRQKRRKARKRIVIEVEIDDGASVDTLLKTLAWGDPDGPPIPDLPHLWGHPINFTLQILGYRYSDTMDEFYKALRIILSSHGLVTFMRTAVLEDQGKITTDDMATMNRVALGLLDVIPRTKSGDKTAALQLRAIEKMLRPEEWNLSKEHIEKVADLDRSTYGENVTSLRYGAELYWLMSQLAVFVVPKQPGKKMRPETEVKLIDKNSRPVWDHDAKGYEWAKRHIRRHSTLQSSAVRAYIEKHQGDEGAIDEKGLQAHLRKTNKWAEQFKPGDDLPQGVKWISIEGGDPLPVRCLANLDPWLLARLW
jgi:hypothetical protein